MSESEQIESWFMQYGDDVYRFLVYFKGTTDVEDLLQETFLRALRSYKHFQGDAAPRTWLLTIARNLAIDEGRRKRPVQVGDDYFATVQSGDESVESTVAEVDSLKNLIGALQALDEKQRTVLILRCVHDLSFKEIGQLLRCSEITARSRFHRGKKEARVILKDYRPGGVLA